MVSKVRNGNFNLQDKKHPKQSKVENEELKQLLKENLCQTQSELANTLAASQQAISKRI